MCRGRQARQQRRIPGGIRKAVPVILILPSITRNYDPEVGKAGGRGLDVVYRTRAASEMKSPDLGAIAGLLHWAFDGDFSTDDWEHATGGVHVTAHRGPALVGHGSVVLRRFLVDERPVHTGYVEAVGVHPDHRGTGIGRGLMEVIANLVDLSYNLGALSATGSALAFYEHLGWERWSGPTRVMGPEGPIPTPDEDGGVFVRRVDRSLSLDAPITCDWRNGDVW